MMQTQNRYGVIFDLDGVLIDSGWAHRQAWYDLADKEGLPMSDEFFYRTFGMQNDQILPMMLGSGVDRERIDALADWKEQRYRELITESVTFADGAEALLVDLKTAGFRLAIGSSAPRANVNLFAVGLCFEKYFDVLVTKESVQTSKPSPETFLKAAEELGLAPQRCAVVEDALAGVEAAQAAGMPVVAVTTTRSRQELDHAELVVDSLAEITAAQFLVMLNRQG